MAYDGSSVYGDIIAEQYDDENNFMNPPSPTGYYVYKIFGYAFDKMQEWITQFRNDLDLLSCDPKSLDKFWGVSYSMPRPTLPTSGRLLTDEEYRRYLYIRNCQLLTERDFLVCFDKCFGLGEDSIYFSETDNYLKVVDALHYTSPSSESSSIGKTSSDDSPDFVTNYLVDSSDTEKLMSGLSSSSSVGQMRINIPNNGWDPEFLEFLTPYLSVKGDIIIEQYS